MEEEQTLGEFAFEEFRKTYMPRLTGLNVCLAPKDLERVATRIYNKALEDAVAFLESTRSICRCSLCGSTNPIIGKEDADEFIKAAISTIQLLERTEG